MALITLHKNERKSSGGREEGLVIGRKVRGRVEGGEGSRKEEERERDRPKRGERERRGELGQGGEIH